MTRTDTASPGDGDARRRYPCPPPAYNRMKSAERGSRRARTLTGLLALAPAGLSDGVMENPDFRRRLGTPTRSCFALIAQAASPHTVCSHAGIFEPEQELGMEVTFVPHLVPLDRGILESIYVSLRRGTTESRVAETLQHALTSAPRHDDDFRPPSRIAHAISASNVGWHVDENAWAGGP